MTPREKFEYVWGNIRDKAQVEPNGYLYVDYVGVIDVEDPDRYVPEYFENPPILLSSEEQYTILRRFHDDGFILIFGKDDHVKNRLWFAFDAPEWLEKDENPYSASQSGTQLSAINKKQTLVIHSGNQDRLYFSSEPDYSLPFKKRNKQSSEKFRIIQFLAGNNERTVSTIDILKHTRPYKRNENNKNLPDNEIWNVNQAKKMQDDIRNINQKFKETLRQDKDLISNIKSGRVNMYHLNTKVFDFEQRTD